MTCLRPFRLIACLLMLATGVACLAAPPPNWDALRRMVAQATGVAGDMKSWRLTGTGVQRGAPTTTVTDFDGEFRFREVDTAHGLSQSFGFDGKNAWDGISTGLSHRVKFYDRDMNRLIMWVESGEWAVSPDLVDTSIKAADNQIELGLKLKDGAGEGTLVLSADTLLPASLTSGDDVWTFADYRPFGGREFPTKIIHTTGGETDETDITDASAVGVSFAMPPTNTADLSFTGPDGEPMPIKRIAGLIFIKPKVDGKDVGWFFFDTGADTTCIDSTVAKQLGLETIGSASVAGVVAVAQYQFGRAKSLQVGPMTLANPLFLELDLAGFSKMLGLPIGGICGYDDLIGWAAFKLDLHANTLRVLRPGAPEMAAAEWTPFEFEGNTPCLTCRFEGDHSSIFKIDTGSASTVDFFSPAVRQFHLLNRKGLKKSMSGGAGGSAASFSGTIGWFELCGKRFLKPVVGFQTTIKGVFSSTYEGGNVGMGFLGQFHSLIFDYANQRIAFEP